MDFNGTSILTLFIGLILGGTTIYAIIILTGAGAGKKAEKIINDAKKKSADMHKAANDYVNGLMERTDEAISKLANEIKQTRKNFKSSAK